MAVCASLTNAWEAAEYHHHAALAISYVFQEPLNSDLQALRRLPTCTGEAKPSTQNLRGL